MYFKPNLNLNVTLSLRKAIQPTLHGNLKARLPIVPRTLPAKAYQYQYHREQLTYVPIWTTSYKGKKGYETG